MPTCALCGSVWTEDEELDARLVAEARKVWPGGDLDYVCAECDALLPPPNYPASAWSTPTAQQQNDSEEPEAYEARRQPFGEQK